MTRFRAFFEELRGAFVERDDILRQIALALLGREHVLVAGPPGTAKSQLASAVLGRIVCEVSGSASLFARQITESTVQTDLIGPIDFKNLTETGRTTHFTDEGLLGNVHAFLDEVFDGRDMLLRSALNLLQEREVKQGGTITRGRIECALMTSNRYISEVLEQSRETLLAFVDRIAFIGFVPRSFSDPSALGMVLRRNVSGTGRPRFDALLTIQDLDILQAATADVYVAPELCDALADLLGRFDAEIASARRADPAFVPTRYVSTRTAVRCGGLLRSACMLDRIFANPQREAEAAFSDFEALRLHLLLAGPSPEQTAKLLEREVDPVEKRQLSIVRTEREIFDACLSKAAPVTTISRRPRAPAPVAATVAARPAAAAEPDEPKDDPLAALEAQLLSARSANDARSLLAVARNAAEHAREGSPDVARARRIMDQATRGASLVGMSATYDATTSDEHPLAIVHSVVSFARSLQDGTTSMHATSRWMHERALDLISDAALYASTAEAKILGDVTDQSYEGNVHGAARVMMDRTTERLSILKELGLLRRAVLSEIATRDGSTREGDAWSKAMTHAEEMIAAWWSRSFAMAMKAARAESRTLDGILAALAPQLATLDDVDARLSAIAGHKVNVKRRVAKARLTDLVQSALAGSHGADRLELMKHIRELHGVLGRHDLNDAVEPAAWLTWTAESLVRGEGRTAADASEGRPSLDGYRALRARGHRVAIACTLAEVSLLVGGQIGSPSASSELSSSLLLESLAPPMKTAIVEADMGRIERALGYLERWFVSVKDASLADANASRFFELLWDEATLARFSTEARLVEELLAEAGERAKSLRARIDTLNEQAHQKGVSLLHASSDAIWASSTP
ncbi:MAG: AAA domain-containing protein [Polyangiaceae bacterium]|nr:AAA domain-containing protein [Polyangiaceae bacterium]